MTAADDPCAVVEREALADAAARWRAGGVPCCEYEAVLFAEWDAEGTAP